MPVTALSRLNPAVYSSFERIVSKQQVLLCKSKSSLPRQRRPLSSTSVYSHFLSYSTSLLRNPGKGQTMAASGPMQVFGDMYSGDLVTSCGNALDFAKQSDVHFVDRTRVSCQKASMSLRKKEQSHNSRLVCAYFMVGATRRNSISSLRFGPLLKNLCTSSTACFSTGSARDMSSDGSSESNDEVLANSPTSTLKLLKLLSGSFYLPHPAKEETGGEDAHFICDEEQAIGVADGVGGWAEVGVNAGIFARELMSNSMSAIKEESKGSIDPLAVLEKAHSGTSAKGSSTACIIALGNEGLQAINLGDSGFIVVRNGSTVFESPVQQHGFNFTYQLESGNGGDLPSSGQVFAITVDAGDVIVAGTDGLFDNLYNNEISAIVGDSKRAGLSPQATAQEIAALARQRAMNRKVQTPFSAAAQEAGFQYYGGKLDDITVVVSYVTNS